MERNELKLEICDNLRDKLLLQLKKESNFYVLNLSEIAEHISNCTFCKAGLELFIIDAKLPVIYQPLLNIVLNQLTKTR